MCSRLGRAFAILVLALASTNARAQEVGRFGLVAAVPESVGVKIEVSRRAALRGLFSFDRQTSETTAGVDARSATESTTSLDLQGQVSLQLYVASWERVRLYLAPGFAYGRSRAEPSAGDSSTGLLTTSTSTSKEFLGLFGGEYSTGRHFAVYGEGGLGAGQGASDVRAGAFRTGQDVTRVRVRASVGVVLRL